MAIVSQQNWLIKKNIMEDIFKKLPKLSLDTPFYGNDQNLAVCSPSLNAIFHQTHS